LKRNMHKKTIVILTLIFLMQSCALEKNKNDIVKFESTFSNKNIGILNKLVLDFDRYLLARFPKNNSLDSSYKVFLTRECKPGNYKYLKSDSIFFANLRDQYKNSDLEKEIVFVPESITLINDKKSLLKIYIYKDQKQEEVKTIRDTFLLPPNPNNIDLEQIDWYDFLEKKSTLRLFNVFGEYYRGLEKVKNRNKFLESYLYSKYQVLEESGHLRFSGFTDFRFEACALINNDEDLTDYFVKRIILIELLN